nr:cardiolipin synthase ClsB [Oceanococcus sp. HetDA_MAG_MS8]
MSGRRWTQGNDLSLLENGEEFFPAVFADIRAARDCVLIETFIWFDDPIGRELQDALLEARKRGVRVKVAVDGFGTAPISDDMVQELRDAGVELLVYDPRRQFLGLQPNLFRRLHRKITVIDSAVAYIGGINYSLEHVREFGALSKQDYAVRIRGPLVADIEAQCLLDPPRRRRFWQRFVGWLKRRDEPVPTGHPDAQAMFIWRDNHEYPRAIEAVYRQAIRQAQRHLVIANAYFFPGYGFLRELRRAAQRGVRVQLILQGEPDKAYVRTAASTLYDYLLNAGVEVWEYRERPLHGKVAVMDDDWATIGSSNLDPFSLSLNLEANVVVRDASFKRELGAKLQRLLDQHCVRLQRDDVPRQRGWRQIIRWLVFHILRKFPQWARWIPAHSRPLQPSGYQGLVPSWKTEQQSTSASGNTTAE